MAGFGGVIASFWRQKHPAPKMVKNSHSLALNRNLKFEG
jgi:hypothetical protein